MDAAKYFHQFLTSKSYWQQIDFSSKKHQDKLDYDQLKVARLIATMPMEKIAGSSSALIAYDASADRFDLKLGITVRDQVSDIIYDWLNQICDYLIHFHFQKKLEKI